MTGETTVERPRSRSSRILLFAFAALALASYCAPWLASTGASLSLNAYDLAEWSSLAPGVRFGAQPMVVPGLLRAQLIFAAAIVALLPTRRGSNGWWLAGTAALAIVMAQLPPLEYFLEESWRADVNYGQQVTFALLALFDAAVCWLMPRGWQRAAALFVFAAAGIVTALIGAIQAADIAVQFDIRAAAGPGVIGYITSLAGVGALALRHWRGKQVA